MYNCRRRKRLRSKQGRQLVVLTRPVEEGESAEGKAGTRRTSSCLLKPSTCFLLELTPGKP